MFSNLTLQDLGIILGFVAGGYILGFTFERFAVSRIKAFAKKTKNTYDDDLANSLQAIPELITTTLGLYLATFFIEISFDYIEQARLFLISLLILFVTAQVARLSSVIVKLVVQRNQALKSSTTIFKNITRVVIYALGILIALQSMGIDVTAIVATLGVGGIAVALALQDTLSNLFSGIYLIAARKIVPGDYIELETGDKGYVEDISWRNTQVRELGDNDMIIIPNANMASAIVKNYYLPQRELSVLVECGVSYDSDLEKVEKIAVEVAEYIQKHVEGAVKNHEPFIRYGAFGDSSINFTTILRGNEYVDQFLLKHEFIKRLHKRFNEEGIEIPFPQRDITVKNMSEVNKK